MRLQTLGVLVTLVLSVGCQRAADPAAVFDGRAGRWLDLSHPFSAETIYWPTATPFSLDRRAYGMTEAGYFYAANDFAAAEHGGTHLDAPIHFAEGRYAADEIPLERLIGPAVVIDVSAVSSPDYQITVSDFASWEQVHGRIPPGAIVLLRTGWGRRYSDRASYLGTDLVGPVAIPELHFPGLAPAAARWLVAEREIDALGIDTPSIDFGQSATFESHVALYEANVPGFENVARLDELAATGAFVIALPMKIAGGSGGPLRVVAFIPDQGDERR